MGLTIHYGFKIKTNPDGARTLVKRLHAVVKKQPFESVGDIYEFDSPDGKYQFEHVTEADFGFKPGDEYLSRKRDDGQEETVIVPAQHVICFHANHPGAETAAFGLASHPPVVLHRESLIEDEGRSRTLNAGAPIEFPTRLCGWYSWSSFCKTQYAADPKCGGVENFLRVHLAIFAVLDECKRLGLKTRIRDDGNYWRHRSKEKLVAELHKYDELIAGFAGKLTDALGNEPGMIVAPIKERSDFEHLEARGDKRLRTLGKPKKKRTK